MVCYGNLSHFENKIQVAIFSIQIGIEQNPLGDFGEMHIYNISVKEKKEEEVRTDEEWMNEKWTSMETVDGCHMGTNRILLHDL